MEPLLFQWHFDPLIALFTAGIIYLYYLTAGFKTGQSAFCFWLGILLFVIATSSPLHFLGMHYYFSAHMITHVLLLLICGPLLVMGAKPKTASPLSGGLRTFSAFLHKRTWLAWMTGVGIMWWWHIPGIFNASFGHMQGFSVIPLVHAGSMLLAGMIFSWPLFGPFQKDHIHPLSGIIYLSAACISCSLLGLLITFAPLSTYQHYLGGGMKMVYGNPWGISPEADLQAAGLIMWVPCCFVYLSGCLFLFQRWFSVSRSTRNNELTIVTSSIFDHE